MAFFPPEVGDASLLKPTRKVHLLKDLRPGLKRAGKTRRFSIYT